MILRETFLIAPNGVVKEIDELPLQLELDDGTLVRLMAEEGELRLTRDFPIPVSLETETQSGIHEILPNGTKKQLPRLRVPAGAGPSHLRPEDIVDGLSFLVDKPLQMRPQGRSRLVPETQEESELLAQIGSDEPFRATGARVSMRTVSLEVNANNIQALLDGPRVGVRLYADALRLPLSTSKFRELWRVLESAFGQKDTSLIKTLASYEPAVQLKFDESELNELLTLRGRASHAETKKPDLELTRVENLCQERLPRLFSLVERVILTKRTWGAHSGEVRKSVPPVKSFVGKNGEVVLIKNWKKQLEEPD
jgi:hypothetical protein